ncbi:hypothetical protein QTP70_022619, partial [Hemibagrus guttatus]
SFYGDGFVQLKTTESSSRNSLHVRFRTSSADGLLFLAAGETDYLWVVLQAGRIQNPFALGDPTRSIRFIRVLKPLHHSKVAVQGGEACTLQVGGEFLPQVEEFKYLRVLFTSEGRMDREIDRWIGAAAAVMRSMYRSVVVKKELSWKAKLSIYQSIYVPTLTYGHELWVMTKRIRSRIQAAEMSFLRRVAGRSLRDRVRSSVNREELRVEPLLLHIKRGQLRWLGHLFRMPPGRLPGEVFRACPTGKRPRGRPRTRWRDYVSRLAWERLGILPEELEEVSREREVWASLLRLLPPEVASPLLLLPDYATKTSLMCFYQTQVQIELGSGEGTLRSEKASLLNDFTWHSIELQHNDHNVTLTVDRSSQSSLSMPGPDLELSVRDGLYVGGFENSDKLYLFSDISHVGYRGCLDEVLFNEHNLLSSLRPYSGYKMVHEVSLGCSPQFSASVNDSISFYSSKAYMSLPMWEVTQEGVFECEFYTSAENGLLLYSSAGKGDYVALEIRHKHLVAVVRVDGSKTALSSITAVSEENWHLVRLYVAPRALQLTVGEENLNSSFAAKSRAFQLNGPLFLGGVDASTISEVRRNGLLSVVSKHVSGGSFKGCLRNIRINGHNMGLPNAMVTKDVSVGCEPVKQVKPITTANPETLQPETPEYDKTKAQTFLHLKDLEVPEGGRAPLESKHIKLNLEFPKLGIRQFQIMFCVEEQPVHGQLRLDVDPDQQENTFSILDLWQGRVMYVHGGSEDPQDFFMFSIFITSTNKEVPGYLKGSHLHRFNITVTPVNDAPELNLPEGNLFILLENSKRHLSVDMLRATDPDSNYTELVFSLLSNLIAGAGFLELADNPGKPVTTFSYTALEQGKVSFVHKGIKNSRMAIRVSDGEKVSNTVVLRIMAVTLEYKIVNNTGVDVIQSRASHIGSKHLAVQVNVAKQVMDIRYDVLDPPVYGELQRLHSNGEWKPVSTFTQKLLEKDRLRYLSTFHGPQLKNVTDGFKCKIIIGSVSTDEFLVQIRVRWIHYKVTRCKMEVKEDRKVTLTPQEFRIVSKNVKLSDSEIHVRLFTLPRRGTLLFNDKPLKKNSTFSQMNITDQKVQYKLFEKPNKDLRDMFSFQVFSEYSYSRRHDFRISIKADVHSVVLRNHGLSLLEGESKIITKDSLFLETFGSGVVRYTITSRPQHGKLIRVNNSSSCIMEFTNQDILEERIMYVHDDSETTHDTFMFRASASSQKDVEGIFNISIQLVNDQKPVRVVDKVFHVVRDGQRLLTLEDFCYHDPDSDYDDGQLLYTRRGISVDELVLVNDTSHKLYQFHQRDLEEKRVLFVHRGMSFGRFVLFVSDGKHYISTLLEVSAQDPYLKIANNTGLLVQKEQEVILQSVNFSVATNTDVRSDEDVLFEIFHPPSHGVLLCEGIEADAFTQYDLKAGHVVYRHDDGRNLLDSFSLTATANGLHLDVTVAVKVYLQSHQKPLRIIHKHSVVVEEGKAVKIHKKELEVVHEDNTPDEIKYTMKTPPSHGFLRPSHTDGDNQHDGTVEKFSQWDINSGHIKYVQEQSGHTNDSFTLDVTNGIVTVSDLVVFVEIIPFFLPLQVSNITLKEGSSQALTQDVIKVTGQHFTELHVQYHVIEGPHHGRIEHSRIPGVPIPSFTRVQVEHEFISYVHDGSETTADNFTLVANDTEVRKQSVPHVIHVNVTPVNDEPPVITANRILRGAGGNWATVGRRSRGGRRVRRQREKRKGKSVGLRIGTLNVGTMTGKGRELADMMERRKVDILCVQETRWKGSKARSIGAGFKLFYYGVDSKRNGVGVVLKEEFVRNVLEVKRVSDRVMSLKLEIEGVMLNVVSGYAPQVGCELEEKERFWSELDEVMESIPTGERVVIGADFNGHVGEGNTGDEEVMGKFGVKERNLEGQMVVDFAKRMDMGVVNTYFQKREEHRVTYKSGGRRTQVDYILCRRGNLKEISDCKVVVGESVARQHRMVVCRMTLMVCKTKRSKIEKKTKWWKLEKEECCEEFRQKLRQALGGQVVLPDDWETTAEVIRETGRKVLGVSSGRRKEDKETWWWNEEVQDSIQRKRLAKKKWDMDRTEENRQEYKELQRRVKREVSKAKQKAYDELYTRLDTREGEKDLYRLARQRDRDGKDVQQVRVIKDRDGRVLTSEESVQRRWKEYFEELMNEENEREKRVEGVNSVEQKVDKIRKDEVRKALKRMKSGKAVGPDDIPVEVWKCLGEAAVEFLANLFNRVLESERMPEEWRRSVLVPIFKNKGDVQSCSNYRGIKLMSHTMKVWERVVEARLRKVVDICEQQYGFMPRKSTTDAIFALRILMEKYRDGQKELHCVFVDLEKAYDRVPREELWYCMRKSGVAEKYVRVVQDMYERSRTVVRCAVGQTEEFNVEVGLHQGSALSPFLFAIVMDQLSEEVRQESPWTMMFADDIVICSESREQVEENLERWRFALERRGMKVSRSKTEYMCVNEREGSGTVRLQGEEVKKVQEFKYLGSTVQSNGECGKEVKKRVQAGWNGWRKVSGVLCDQKISARIKGKVYRTVVRPAMLYGLETVSLRKRQESELEVWVDSVTEITSDDLSATDRDSAPESLEFIVTLPSNGHLALKSAPSRSVLNFTQAHIHHRQLVFIHSGAMFGGFHFQVNDGVNFAPRQIFSIAARSLTLSLERNRELKVFPGSSKVISVEDLFIATNDYDDVHENRSVIYSVTSPPRLGRLIRARDDNSTETEPISTFTHNMLKEGLVVYEHTEPISWTATDSFIFTASSPPASFPPHTFTINISYDNTSPEHRSVLRANTGAVVVEGSRIMIDESKLDASNLLGKLPEEERDSYEIWYRVTTLPRFGTIVIGERNLSREKPDFSQFILNKYGITHPPEKDLLVSELFNITVTPVNDLPPLLKTQAPSLLVVKGETVTLGPENLHVEDLDTLPEDIHYTVISKPNNGFLALDGRLNEPTATFTQADVNEGRVHFVQEGHPSSGILYFSVTDGFHRPLYKLFNLEVHNVTINILNNTGLTLVQGQTKGILAPRHLAAVTNKKNTTIKYYITTPPSHGRLVIKEDQITHFDQEELLLGKVAYQMTDLSSSQDSFEFTVVTSESNLTDQAFSITVKPLIHLGKQVRIPDGIPVKIRKDVLDATELASISGSDPVFEIIVPPKYGKLV